MVAKTQIIATGGTIASLPQENGDVIATLAGNQFLDRYETMENVTIRTSVTKGSFAFDYETLYTIGNDVLETVHSSDVSGVVVTHGTDTMEETAFFLSLIAAGTQKPIVLTGAQLNASHPSTDGLRNLMDAIRVAQTPVAGKLNVVVVFAGFIHTARDVQKIDTNALEAFDSPGWGPVGRVDEDQVIIARSVRKYPPLQLNVPKPVALIRLGVGMTGTEFRRMVDGYGAVVLETFGRGNAHPSFTAEVKSLVHQGVPVVVTSRCIRGSVLPVYGNGGGRDLERSGAWFAGDLKGEKVRILLGLLLANNATFDEMANVIAQYSQP
ncbi:asparaginase [Thermoactinomyces sp. CICC 10522]|nr:asparaginase [Thermoactinomyces sp. CICC 10522]